MPDECFCPGNPQPVHRLSRFSSNSIIVFQKKNARSQLTGQKIPCNFYILTPTPPPPLFWNYRGCCVRDRDYLVQISLYQTLPDSSSLRKNNTSHRKKFRKKIPSRVTVVWDTGYSRCLIIIIRRFLSCITGYLSISQSFLKKVKRAM